MEKANFADVIILFVGGFFTIIMVMGIAIYALNVSRKRIAFAEREKARMALEEQGKMLKATIEGSELARKKIAEELHDQINAQLTVVRMAMARNATVDPEAVQTLDDTIQDLRAMSRELMPPVLERFGLLDALDDLFDRVESQTGLIIEFDAPEDWDKTDVQKDLALYRIVQEFVQNTLKYGKANTVTVKVLVEDVLTLEIKDDGVGFDSNTMEEGLGTRNMKSRIEYLKGTYQYTSSPGQGVYLRLTLPK